MKRLLFLAVCAGFLASCIHPWVGRPVTQLEKEMGRPLRIRPSGPNRIYVYRDTLAGFGEMTFTIDSKGIVRGWDASNNVPGPFGGDVFGIGVDASGNPVGDPSIAAPTSPNGGTGGQPF
jgi:hypothetical protein